MTQFGNHIRISIDAARRDAVRDFFVKGFGAEHRPLRETIDLFSFEDGAVLGVFYVAAEKALSREAYEVAPWLEFRVKNADAAATALLAHGGERVENPDAEHQYLRMPGGPIFRLAVG